MGAKKPRRLSSKQTNASTPVADLDPANVALGRRVGALRAKIGMSRKELSRRSGVALTSLVQLERGWVSPSFITLTRLPAPLGVSLPELVDGLVDVVFDPESVAKRYLLRKLHGRSLGFLTTISNMIDALDESLDGDTLVASQLEVVYFLGDGSQVKIGFTSDLDRRRASVEQQLGRHLQVYATTPGGRILERRYHQLFDKHRLDGEWFRLADEIVSEIELLGGNITNLV